MSEQDTGLRHAVAPDVTRDAFDENLTFGEALPLALSPAGEVRIHRSDRPARGGLWPSASCGPARVSRGCSRARRLRMSEQDTGLRHAVAPDVTRDAFDENLTGGRSSGTSVRHANPPPLSALCTANEVAVVMEAGPDAESFVNANGSDCLAESRFIRLRRQCPMGRTRHSVHEVALRQTHRRPFRAPISPARRRGSQSTDELKTDCPFRDLRAG